MIFEPDPDRPAIYRITDFHGDQVCRLRIALGEAIDLAADQGGILAELLEAIAAGWTTERLAREEHAAARGGVAWPSAAPPCRSVPPVLLGPGGDFVEPWPAGAGLRLGHPPVDLESELIGGDVGAAMAEASAVLPV